MVNVRVKTRCINFPICMNFNDGHIRYCDKCTTPIRKKQRGYIKKYYHKNKDKWNKYIKK